MPISRLQLSFYKTLKIAVIIVLVVATLPLSLGLAPSANPLVAKAQAAATCSTPTVPETYGKVTQTITVSSAGTYRVWSRLKAPNSSANSYYLQVDSDCPRTVGDASQIPANAWTWVNYQDATTTATIDVSLAAGPHTLSYIGREANVLLDKVLLLADPACVPTGLGENCMVTDTTAPVVSITSPTADSTASGQVTIQATAYDLSEVTKVEFYLDDFLMATDTTGPDYSYSWDSTQAANGPHAWQAKAYDNAVPSNVGTSSTLPLTVSNAPAVGRLDMDSSLIVDKATVQIDGTVSATAIYKNNSNFPVTVQDIRLSARTPDATSSVQSPFFAADTAGPYTVQPGMTVGVAGRRTITAADATGTYWAYAEYIDSAGLAHTDSTETSFVVTEPDTAPPTVALATPSPDAGVTVGDFVNITAEAADNVAATQVTLYVDGLLKATLTAAPYTYAWNTAGLPAGSHTIQARAADAAGNSAASPLVTVALTAVTPPPAPSPTPPPPPPPANTTGTGLTGNYFNDAFFGKLALTRTDPTINFNWGRGAPAAGIGKDLFTVRWTGYVLAPKTGLYTFYTSSDDGVRLWINDTLLISNWTDHSAITNSGKISLVAGQKYPLKLEYYEKAGQAVAKLYWKVPGGTKRIVPQAQLYAE